MRHNAGHSSHYASHSQEGKVEHSTLHTLQIIVGGLKFILRGVWGQTSSYLMKNNSQKFFLANLNERILRNLQFSNHAVHKIANMMQKI